MESKNEQNGLSKSTRVPKTADQNHSPLLNDIQQLREVKATSKINIDNYQKQITYDQQLTKEKKSRKESIEQHVIRLLSKVNGMNYCNKEMESQTQKIHDMSKLNGEHLDKNKTIHKDCLRSKSIATALIQKQNEIANEKLAKEKERLKSVQDFKMQQKISADTEVETMQENVESLEILSNEKIKCSNVFNKESEDICKSIKTIDQHLKELDFVINQKNSNAELKKEQFQKQLHIENTSEEIEKTKTLFKYDKEMLCNALDESKLKIQQTENEFGIVKQGALDQENLNISLNKKILQTRIANDALRVDVKLHEEVEVECKSDHNDELHTAHNVRLAKTIKLETRRAEEVLLLSNIKQNLEESRQLMEEAKLKRVALQATYDHIQQQNVKCLENNSEWQNQMVSVKQEINKLLEETENTDSKAKTACAKETETLIASRTEEVRDNESKISEIKKETQDKEHEMKTQFDELKHNSDILLQKQTLEFDSMHSNLASDLEKITKAFKDQHNLFILLESELKQLSEECDVKKVQIHNQENLRNVFSNNSLDTFEVPKFSKKPKARTGTVENFGVFRNVKRKEFDEMSCGSNDSAMFVYKKMNEEKERRRHKENIHGKKSRK